MSARTSLLREGIALLVLWGLGIAIWEAEAQTVGPVTYSAHEVDDDTENPGSDMSKGDDDGLIENGETIRLQVTLSNIGDAQASDVNATLSTKNPNVQIMDADELYASVAPGTPKRNGPGGGFEFVYSSEANGKVSFTLTVRAANGGPWTSTFDVDVKGGVIGPLELSSQTVKDKGDGDGLIENGEPMELSLTLTNQGTAPVLDLDTVLSTTDANTLVGQGQASYGVIPDDESNTLSATFKFTYQGEAGVNIPFVLSRASGEKLFSFELPAKGGLAGPLEIPSVPEIGDSVSYPTYARGDGDGQAENGESVKMKVPLRNAGTAPAVGVQAILTTDSLEVVIEDNKVVYGTVSDGETVERDFYNDTFAFSVPLDATQTKANFVLEATSGSESWSLPFTITIGINEPPGPLEVSGFRVTGGDGDERPEREEQLSLSVTIKNQGKGTAYDVAGTLSTVEEGVTIRTDEADYGIVGGGQTKEKGFGFTYLGDEDKEISLILALAASNGGPWDVVVTLRVFGVGNAGPVEVLGYTIYDIDGDKKVQKGERISLNVTVQNNGTLPAVDVQGTLSTDEPATTIHTSSGYGLIGDGQTNSGSFTFTYTGDEDKEINFILTLTAGNGGPWDGVITIPVIGEGTVGPLAITGWEIKDGDDIYGYVEGNGNGVPEPGEEVNLGLEVINNGTLSAFGVVWRLSTTSGDARITDSVVDSSDYGTIKSGGKRKLNLHYPWECFRVRIPETATSAAIPFTLSLTATSGGPWEIPFELPIGAEPRVDPDQSTVDVDRSSVPAGGTSTVTITVMPKDQGGTDLGSGQSVSIETSLGTLIGAVTDNQDGTYTQQLQSQTAGTSVISVTVNGLQLSSKPSIEFSAGPASRIAMVSGNGQSGTVGNALGAPLLVKVMDSNDVPVPDFTVTFAVISGGGSLASETATTDARGEAPMILVLGAAPGVNEVEAKANKVGGTPLDGSPILFTVTGMPAQSGGRRQFSLLLVPGANIVSLPLIPDGATTARSFAQRLRATVVVGIEPGEISDPADNRLLPFLPDVSSGDGFPIECGKGYIVHIMDTQAKQVLFTGTACGEEIPAAPTPANPFTHTWAFTVVGFLPGSAEDLRVTVRNLETGGVVTTDMGTFGPGGFAGVFVNLDRHPVVSLGDVLEVTIQDSQGASAMRPVLQVVQGPDIRRGYLLLPTLACEVLPETDALLQNYPNPFNAETWIPFQMKEPAQVTVRILDPRGRLVRVLSLGLRSPGVYVWKNQAAYWDGRNEEGESVASGVYYYSIETGGFRATKRMVIAK